MEEWLILESDDKQKCVGRAQIPYMLDQLNQYTNNNWSL